MFSKQSKSILKLLLDTLSETSSNHLFLSTVFIRLVYRSKQKNKRTKTQATRRDFEKSACQCIKANVRRFINSIYTRESPEPEASLNCNERRTAMKKNNPDIDCPLPCMKSLHPFNRSSLIQHVVSVAIIKESSHLLSRKQNQPILMRQQ